MGQWILQRVLELSYTSWDLRSLALDYGYQGSPFRWDVERRFTLRCELDAAYFHLYGLQEEEVCFVLDSFPLLQREERKRFGEYRTGETILHIYRQLRAAMLQAHVE